MMKKRKAIILITLIIEVLLINISVSKSSIAGYDSLKLSGYDILYMSRVFAGSINGAEAVLLGKAAGTFEYKGKRYIATNSALNRLKAHLCKDSINLTQDQADRAASLMYSNIRGGIVDGVLIPVDVDENANGSVKEDTDIPSGGTEEDAEGTKIMISDIESAFEIIDEEGTIIFTSQLPVKNTGFNMGGFIFVIFSLALCIPLGMFVAWKRNLLAGINEK